MELKSNMNYWIEKSGYQKKWIAKQIGVSPAILSKWINDKSKPSVDNLFKLASILNCKVDDLYIVDRK